MKTASGLAALSAILVACGVAPATPQLSPTSTPPLYVATATVPPAPALPTPEPSPTSAPTAVVCNEANGRLIQTSYPGAVLAKEIPLEVYLPPCYDDGGEEYPSVILLHGKPLSQADWDDLGADELVDERIRQGTWAPFILVIPIQPEPLFSDTDGGPGSYEAEVIQGLLPFVETTFRTRRSSAERAIAGISRGGVWALEIAFLNPEIFGQVAALSPALALNYARPAYNPLEIARLGAEEIPPRIYLGAGETDWARAKTVELAEALEAHGEGAVFEPVVGGHESVTWQALMPGMFEYLAAGWPSSP